MYTRVAAAWVGFVVARVGLVVEKSIPKAAEVGPARTWVGRYAEHIASTVAWFVVTVARFDLAIFVVDLAVVAVDLAVGSFSLAIARIALSARKVSLVETKVVHVVVEDILVVARVLEKCPKIFRTESGHNHPRRWTSQAESTA